MRVGHLRRIGSVLTGAIGLLICTGLSGAQAEGRLEEDALRGRWLFSPGRTEVSAQAGGGFSDRDIQLIALIPRIGYIFAQQEAYLPGSLEAVGEPSYIAAFEGRTAHVGGLAALLKYNFWTGTRLTPYLLGGGGISYASIRVPRGGTNFNFTVQAGLGLHYTLGQHSTLNFEWRYQHFSNGNISPPNPSLNSSSILMGFSFLY